MKENTESSQKQALSKSTQKKLWQRMTYEICCKNLKKRTISRTARIHKIKTSTFSRLKKKGDSGIDFLTQKGQGKPKEFDDQDILQIPPTKIAGRLDLLQATMRLKLAQKRNISLDRLDPKLVSRKYLCDLKKRWFQLYNTDKKKLKADLKKSSHPLNIIQNQQFPCSSNCSSDLSSDLINEEQHQQFSQADSLETQQSSAFNPSDNAVSSSIQDINSYQESQENPNFLSQGFNQEPIENSISNNSSAAIQGQQESQQSNYCDQQQWPSSTQEPLESPSQNFGLSTFYGSLDVLNSLDSNCITEFDCDHIQSPSNSLAQWAHQCFPSPFQRPMSSLFGLESDPNQDSFGNLENSTQATNSFQGSQQLQFSNNDDSQSSDDVSQYLSYDRQLS